ncbi:MAG: hypothetical protein HWE34_10275 [Methylocystaceae bacterium]|nr:hypothetical protein [Methylocystaceae bacterium]
MRFILQYILPLAFPTALYLLWALYHKRKADSGVHIDLSKGPWIWLALAGVLLTGMGLAIYNFTTGEEPGGVYQAPHMENGEIVPGRVIHND